MRLIPIDEAKPGMILAKTIARDETGQVLLKANYILSSYHIQKFKNLGHDFIYINDSAQALNEEPAPEPIQAETKHKASAILKETSDKLQNNQEIDIAKIQNVVLEMIDQILAKPEISYNLTKIDKHDNYTYTHSVNVSILSLMTGALMGLKPKELENLGIGALLHDIGKTHIDLKILNKPSSLEPEEFEMIKTHPRNGYEILKKQFPQSYLPANIALQHHERIDGSGYPKGLSADKIHKFAKIVAVADVFDAITTNRIYKKAKPAYVGISEINNNIGTKFDILVVNHFTRIVAPYPVGSVLLIDNKDKAIVTYISKKECLIRFLSGSFNGQIIDLYQSTNIKVTGVISR